MNIQINQTRFPKARIHRQASLIETSQKFARIQANAKEWISQINAKYAQGSPKSVEVILKNSERDSFAIIKAEFEKEFPDKQFEVILKKAGEIVHKFTLSK